MTRESRVYSNSMLGAWMSAMVATSPTTMVQGDENILSMPMLGHKTVYRRRFEELLRSRKLVDSPLGMSALYQGYGTHYVDLWVGTPNPQRQTVIVDTGSSITAFPCAGCENCGWEEDGDQYHTDNYFDYHQSATFRKLDCNECQAGSCSGNECKMHMSYAEGSSWSAFEGQDFLYAGGSHEAGVTVDVDPVTRKVIVHPEDVEGTMVTKFEVPYNFGCQTSLTGLFKTQLADGIMGMSNERHTFWDQIYRSGKLTQKLFSLCFSRSDLVEYEGTGAGAMTLGGTNTALHKSPMVFAKETKGGGFFTVYVKKVFLRKGGGESAKMEPDQTGNDMIPLDITEANLNNHGVIFDSGTTDTYFTRDLANSFKKEWKTLTGENYANKAVDLTLEEIRNYPTVIVQLEGMPASYYKEKYPTMEVEPQHMVGLAGEMEPKSPYDVYLAIPASHYFEFDEDVGKYTPRIYLDERSGSVLGANAMQGHDIFFNVEEQVIGIAESDCDYLTLGLPGGIRTSSEKIAVEPGDTYDINMSPHAGASYHDDAKADSCTGLACKGLLGVGGMLVIVGIAVVLPALKRWRARSKKDYVMTNAVEPYRDHPSNDLTLEDDDDMSDHGVGVEIMKADRRSIV